ncbi:MAG: large conductance mechanosensitive channel protein MscL [Gaiellaceae bacterium]
MLKDFKDFLFKGNILDLAIALVMGLATVALVNALVTDLVMPIVGAIIGKPSFNDLHFTIHKSVFLYGSFITALITFASIAAAVYFFIVKPVEAVRGRFAKPGEEVPSDEERRHQELLAALQTIGK